MVVVGMGAGGLKILPTLRGMQVEHQQRTSLGQKATSDPILSGSQAYLVEGRGTHSF